MKPKGHVRVGSLNAAKLEAVRLGLAPFFSQLSVEGQAVKSGVSEQPIGFEEILVGARTRAQESWKQGNCDLAAGIEDGLIPMEGVRTGFMNVGVCVLWNGQEEAVGLTSGFEYPPDCVRVATAAVRMPIGDAFEERFVPPESWPEPTSGSGNIGRLTGGVLTRAEYGAQAVTCAFVRLLHPALYEGEHL